MMENTSSISATLQILYVLIYYGHYKEKDSRRIRRQPCPELASLS
jgi:hypothetical protein